MLFAAWPDFVPISSSVHPGFTKNGQAGLMHFPSQLASTPGLFARRNATVLKLLFVAFLVLVLLAPLHLVESTLHERLARHDGAVATITQAWGKAQRMLGPVLVVPYSFKTETEEWVTGPDGRRFRDKVVRTQSAEAFFLPEQLEIGGTLEPAERKLGIYSTHVYAATLRLDGRFAPPSFAFTGLPAPEPQWDRARVCFAISDLRGTREALTLRWGGADLALQSGSRLEGFGTGLHAPVKLNPGAGPLEYSINLTLNGSGGISFVPVGRQTSVQLASPWQGPGFFGAFLPVSRDVSVKGFNATWKVSYYGRDFPQQWSSIGGSAPAAQVVEAAGFGVNLIESVTAYRTIERAIKYGVLFLGLAFATFFLFETLSAVRLNALNYLLVGAALCLFYLGLLSLSEFIGFTPAYVAAAGVSLVTIGLYSWSVLHSSWRAVLISAMLGGVYGYLYFVLRMEDFALLAGTAALFALLAAVMYATRRIEDVSIVDTQTLTKEAAS
jgi:inner membrane protein